MGKEGETSEHISICPPTPSLMPHARIEMDVVQMENAVSNTCWYTVYTALGYWERYGERGERGGGKEATKISMLCANLPHHALNEAKIQYPKVITNVVSFYDSLPL